MGQSKINDAIASAIETGWDKHAEIWSDLSWDGLHIVLDDQATHARDEYVLEDSHITRTSLTYEDPASTITGYRFWSQGNVRGVFLAHSGQPQDLVSTIETFFHESYHQYEQNHWTPFRNANTVSRDMTYPVSGEPLYYRGMVLRGLQAYQSDPAAHPLSEVKFWQDKLIQEYAQHAGNWAYFDRIEGTAQYFTEKTDEGIGQTPVNGKIPEEGFNDNMLAQFLTQQADILCYTIGSTACRILETQLPNWKTRVESGEDPLNLLLETVTLPTTPPLDSDSLHQEITAMATTTNVEYAKIFEPFLSHFDDPNFIEVKIPCALMAGSFMTNGMWNIVSKDGVTHSVMTDFQAQFCDPSTNWQLALQDQGTIVETTVDDQGQAYLQFFLPTNSPVQSVDTIFAGIGFKKTILPSQQIRINVGEN